MHCECQVVVRSPGLSVISVQCGRQTLWVRLSHLTAMHAASWSHHQMAPPIVNFAEALTNDAADPVDLLRSCMRSGENQLSPEHIILERAAAERSRRKQRQAFSQSSSPQSEPVVSSNAFLVQSGVCLKRAEPVITRFVSWSSFHPWAMSCRCAVFWRVLTRSMRAARPL